MRLNINLASQKYEDVRQFYVRWGTAVVVTAVLTVLLAALAGLSYSSSSQSSQRIKDLQHKISALEQERAAAEAFENRPENHDVTEQKNFWNRQIRRRSFSWTQLFNDLQRIMPSRAYVESIHPEITPDNRLKLTLQIVGEKYDNALEVVRKMEGSERFRSPHILGETTQKDPKSGLPIHKFDIETYYTSANAPSRSGAREVM